MTDETTMPVDETTATPVQEAAAPIENAEEVEVAKEATEETPAEKAAV